MQYLPNKGTHLSRDDREEQLANTLAIAKWHTDSGRYSALESNMAITWERLPAVLRQTLRAAFALRQTKSALYFNPFVLIPASLSLVSVLVLLETSQCRLG